jgi:hypothetical protein
MDLAHHIDNNKNARNAPWIVRIADNDLPLRSERIMALFLGNSPRKTSAE